LIKISSALICDVFNEIPRLRLSAVFYGGHAYDEQRFSGVLAFQVAENGLPFKDIADNEQTMVPTREIFGIKQSELEQLVPRGYTYGCLPVRVA